MSRISSGVLPSIRRASPLLVRSTRGVTSRESAALVSSQSLLVSSCRMYFSSKSLRSCGPGGRAGHGGRSERALAYLLRLLQGRRLLLSEQDSDARRRRPFLTRSDRPACLWNRQYARMSFNTSGRTCKTINQTTQVSSSTRLERAELSVVRFNQPRVQRPG